MRKALKHHFEIKTIDMGKKKKGSGFFMAGKVPCEHWVLNSA